MTQPDEFKRGDKVKITDHVSAYYNKVGTVSNLSTLTGGLYVQYENGNTVYHPWGYELVEQSERPQASSRTGYQSPTRFNESLFDITYNLACWELWHFGQESELFDNSRDRFEHCEAWAQEFEREHPQRFGEGHYSGDEDDYIIAVDAFSGRKFLGLLNQQNRELVMAQLPACISALEQEARKAAVYSPRTTPTDQHQLPPHPVSAEQCATVRQGGRDCIFPAEIGEVLCATCLRKAQQEEQEWHR